MQHCLSCLIHNVRKLCRTQSVEKLEDILTTFEMPKLAVDSSNFESFLLKLIIIHPVKTKEIRTVTIIWKCNLTHRFIRFYFSVVLVSIEKIFQTLERVFHNIFKPRVAEYF